MSWGIKIAGTPDNVIAAVNDPVTGGGMIQSLKDSIVAVANEVKDAGENGYYDGVYVESSGHVGGNSSNINKHEVYAIKLAPTPPVAAPAEVAPAADTAAAAPVPADNAA